MNGFFKNNGQWWYFSISDLRWSKDNMLIRTAKDAKDYTGGPNQYIALNGNMAQFTSNFDCVVFRG